MELQNMEPFYFHPWEHLKRLSFASLIVIFLFLKHLGGRVVWGLSTSNEYPQHVFFFKRNKKNISNFQLQKSALSGAMHIFVCMISGISNYSAVNGRPRPSVHRMRGRMTKKKVLQSYGLCQAKMGLQVYLDSKGPDQLVHLQSLIRAITMLLGSCQFLEKECAQVLVSHLED